MMAFEAPFLAGVIARSVNPEFNLAAHGVAYALALLTESPVIMLMAASTSLVTSSLAYQRMRNFTFTLTVFVTVLILMILIPGVFQIVVVDIMNLPPEVAHFTYLALLFLIPWPGAIGYRRFIQGLLIAGGRTRLISYGTLLRVLSMAVTALSLVKWSGLPGAAIGAAALSVGVSVEALASHLMARHTIRELKARPEGKHPAPGYKKIIRFYYPLALATLIGLGAQPLVTVFVGKSRLAIPSLAALPVVYALVFIFRSVGLSYHEVVITFLQRHKENIRRLRHMSDFMFAITSGMLALIVFSPLSGLWFRQLSGLDAELARLAENTARILVLMPGLSILISYQRAIHVVTGSTKYISRATMIEVGGIGLLMLIFIIGFDMIGAYAAAFALVGGRFFANLFLFVTNRSYRNYFS